MYGCGLRSAPVFMCAAVRLRKVRPAIWLNSGMQFPAEASSGKRVPEYRLKLGRSFPSGPVPETATRNIGSERDALSQTVLNRKLHPSLRPQNGTQLPPDQLTLPFRRSTACILNFVHRKYMNTCSMRLYLPGHFLSKNFATPKTQSRQGFSCSTVGT